MGLDMYLTARRYISQWQPEDKELAEKIKEVVDTKGFRPKSLEVDAGYWRKANAIHDWFVRNIQDGEDDCKEYYLSKPMAQKLLDTVNEVLADHSKAEDLLPTTAGFFFGPTDYEEYYFQDLKDTKEIMEKVLENFYAEGETLFWDVTYQSSW